MSYIGTGDSSEMPDNRCTNCIRAQNQCTHARPRPAEKTPPPESPPLIGKTAQEHIKDILSPATVYIPPADPHQVLVQIAQYARTLEERLAALQAPMLSPIARSPKAPPPRALGTLTDADEQPPIKGLLTGLLPNTKAHSFYGKSSSVQFLHSVIQRIHGNTSIWEKLIIDAPQQVFPDEDLLISLVDVYFEQVNPIIGILHSPTFRRAVAEGLHSRDQAFGAVVLAVCSLASRYSDDPRVLLDGVSSELSRGWKWFHQLLFLSILFLSGTWNPEECWILAALGLRSAQGAGAHHRSGYGRMKPLEAELYKRVFYFLLVSDTIMSSLKGRPCLVHDIDFDLDLPLDCDEEYWETPNAVQPRGKPSISAFPVAYLPLMLIAGRIQKAVYPVNGQPPSQDTIAELDSELNKWVDALPEHLRWNPNQDNQIFLDQSAALYATYYHAHIVMHRPFIPAPGKESLSNTNSPSLAICANAARSCGHVMDVQMRRGRGLLPLPQLIPVLFNCAVVLLINVWAVVGQSQTTERYNRTTADVQNCIRVLRFYERRSRVAGRNCDIISAMLNIGKYTSDASLKRPRDTGEAPNPSEGFTVSDGSEASSGARPNTGTSRINALSVAQQIQALELSVQETDHLFALPLHTADLGRLPIYDSFDYNFTFQLSDILSQSSLHMDPRSNQLGSIEPEFLDAFEAPSATGSKFSAPQSGGTLGREEMQMDYSVDIPSGYGWKDWSTYLDGLNQDSF
ncbi:fungal-specific transcription factor domain-containing protein [Mycena rosella]|uniref:Fungal-specific transcription factor domain-containing protein n=1 Tax=Mycena rosella TaxID=1033263 RepID=A0AAD7D3R3_MYCRO|nr:fungal-specific transcription factor domain-containing protein [Mycena rosella]